MAHTYSGDNCRELHESGFANCCGCLCYDTCLTEQQAGGIICYTGNDVSPEMEAQGYSDAISADWFEKGQICSTISYRAGYQFLNYGSCAVPTACANNQTCDGYADCTETCCDSSYCNGDLLNVQVSSASVLRATLAGILLALGLV